MSKYGVSIYIQGKVSVSVYVENIEAEDNFSAVKKAVSKVYTSGELSPRACALMKEAATHYCNDFHCGYEKRNGVAVDVWAVEQKSEGKNKMADEIDYTMSEIELNYIEKK